MPDPTETYLAHREVLFSVVYNVLGSVADTEDVRTRRGWRGRGGMCPLWCIRARTSCGSR